MEELTSLPGMTVHAAYGLLLWRPYLSWDEAERALMLEELDFDELRAAGLTLEAPPWADWTPSPTKN